MSVFHLGKKAPLSSGFLASNRFLLREPQLIGQFSI